MRTRPVGISLALAAMFVATFVEMGAHFPAAAATTTLAIECRMSIPARVQNRATIPLTFELINKTKNTLNILNRDTPFEGFYGQYFEITGPDGATVEYRGRVVKRASTPTREEYVSIKKGDKLAVTVNLAPPYDFKGKGTGRYEVMFAGKLFDATKEKIPRAFDQQTSMEIACPPVKFDLAAGK